MTATDTLESAVRSLGRFLAVPGSGESSNVHYLMWRVGLILDPSPGSGGGAGSAARAKERAQTPTRRSSADLLIRVYLLDMSNHQQIPYLQ